MVKAMAATGTPHEHIARKIGVRSPKTVRKHFREELDSGMLDPNHSVTATLYKMATSGDCAAATIYWDKTRGRHREHHEAPPPFIVGQDMGSQPHA